MLMPHADSLLNIWPDANRPLVLRSGPAVSRSQMRGKSLEILFFVKCYTLAVKNTQIRT